MRIRDNGSGETQLPLPQRARPRREQGAQVIQQEVQQEAHADQPMTLPRPRGRACVPSVRGAFTPPGPRQVPSYPPPPAPRPMPREESIGSMIRRISASGGGNVGIPPPLPPMPPPAGPPLRMESVPQIGQQRSGEVERRPPAPVAPAPGAQIPAPGRVDPEPREQAPVRTAQGGQGEGGEGRMALDDRDGDGESGAIYPIREGGVLRWAGTSMRQGIAEEERQPPAPVAPAQTTQASMQGSVQSQPREEDGGEQCDPAGGGLPEEDQDVEMNAYAPISEGEQDFLDWNARNDQDGAGYDPYGPGSARYSPGGPSYSPGGAGYDPEAIYGSGGFAAAEEFRMSAAEVSAMTTGEDVDMEDVGLPLSGRPRMELQHLRGQQHGGRDLLDALNQHDRDEIQSFIESDHVLEVPPADATGCNSGGS